MPVSTRRGAARLRAVTNLGDLHDAMDEEDDELLATIKVEQVKGTRIDDLDGNSDDDPAKTSEDEDDADAKLVDEVKNADTHKDTKHGYRLSLQRLIVFLYTKRSKNKMYRVLHKDLVADLRKVKEGSAKSSLKLPWLTFLEPVPNITLLIFCNLILRYFSHFCCQSRMQRKRNATSRVVGIDRP